MDVPLEYSVVRRKGKRRVTLVITPENRLSVIVPPLLSEKRIRDIVIEKSAWVRKKLLFNQQAQSLYRPKQFISGETFSFLGEDLKLEVLADTSFGVEKRDGRLRVRVAEKNLNCPETVEAELLGWFKANAREVLLERVRFFQGSLQVDPGEIRLRNMKSAWGICAADKHITFNWRLIIAPLSIVDYVVVHELCHLLYLNHSPLFWGEVEKVLPDHRERKKWLKLNGRTLQW